MIASKSLLRSDKSSIFNDSLQTEKMPIIRSVGNVNTVPRVQVYAPHV